MFQISSSSQTEVEQALADSIQVLNRAKALLQAYGLEVSKRLVYMFLNLLRYLGQKVLTIRERGGHWTIYYSSTQSIIL